MGNVLSVITPDASDTTQPAIESLTDYYPFGMEMGGRSYTSNDYRFGYTGHEKENDLAEGVYTTQYRLLDTRLGRWMSVDPLFGKYPISSYNYALGNPIFIFDLYGGEPTVLNRVGGGLMMVGGATEMVASGFGEVISGGAATPLSLFLFLNGIDNFRTGFNQLWTGEEQKTELYKGVRYLSESCGASEEISDKFAMTVDFASGMVNPSKSASTCMKVVSSTNRVTSKSVLALTGQWVTITRTMNSVKAAKYQSQIAKPLMN